MKLSKRAIAPTKSGIFNTVWNNTKLSMKHGNRAETTDGKGYTLFVDGLYQGSYVDYIDVIGDKKGGTSTKMLLDQPDKWSNILMIFNSLAVSVKVIHVIRNPYDNIATGLLYSYSSPSNFGIVKQSNQTYQFNPNAVNEKIKSYFTFHKAIVDATKTYNLDIIELHGKDLISDPRGTLLKLCNNLRVNCSDNYLDICSNKVYKSESRTRLKIKWTDDQLKEVQENIEKYSNLKDYSFDSM